jgi:SET domain-containing protein
MVIEYIGELIRNEVANKREKLYEEHNRGIYMFRVDDDYVVDATMSGCLARYINHSCEVNKYSKFVSILLLSFFLSNSQIQ